MTTVVASRSHPISIWSAVIVGAVVFAALCLLFWATAAAQTLSDQVPTWVRNFQPAAGVANLALGLLWSALIGGALVGVGAVLVNAVRKATRPA